MSLMRLKRYAANEAFKGTTRLTWSGRSRYVRPQKVESTTTSTRSRRLRLRLETVDPPRDHAFDMSVNDLTPAGLTEAALRAARRLGEPGAGPFLSGV